MSLSAAKKGPPPPSSFPTACSSLVFSPLPFRVLTSRVWESRTNERTSEADETEAMFYEIDSLSEQKDFPVSPLFPLSNSLSLSFFYFPASLFALLLGRSKKEGWDGRRAKKREKEPESTPKIYDSDPPLSLSSLLFFSCSPLQNLCRCFYQSEIFKWLLLPSCASERTEVEQRREERERVERPLGFGDSVG